MEDSKFAYTSSQSDDTVVEIYPRSQKYEPGSIGVPEKLRLGNNKTAVVSVIGSTLCGNASVLNNITGTPLFTDIELGSGFQFNDAEGTSIRIFHDSAKNVIYLYLVSFLDRKMIDLKVSSMLSTNPSSSEFRNWLDRAELQGVKALLYIFMISHYVLHISNDTKVPVQDFRLLKVLQQTKQAISPDISKYFQEMNAVILSRFPTLSSTTDTRFFPG